MKLRAPLCFLLMVSCCAPAAAITESDKFVDRLGVQGGNTAYFNVKDGLSTNCKFGIVYFDLSDDFGRAAYANILASQVAGRKLSRFDYSQSSSDETCVLSLVEARG